MRLETYLSAHKKAQMRVLCGPLWRRGKDLHQAKLFGDRAKKIAKEQGRVLVNVGSFRITWLVEKTKDVSNP